MGNTQAIPPKNSFYQAKEHFADGFTVTQEKFDVLRINIDDLFTSDLAQLKVVGEKVVEGLSKDNMLALHASPEFRAKIVAAQEDAKKFLVQSEAKKKERGAEKVDGKRVFYSGYSQVHFENRDNRRDEEWRDVFQIRFSESDHIPWPTDAFKSSVMELYNAEWAICVQVMHAIALALDLNPRDLIDLVGSENADAAKPDPYNSSNTNLCLFRYFDKHSSYKTPQRCMVHCDHGLLTLLPRTDVPGLELLHPTLKQWIPVENQVGENDVLLYCGEALAEITNSRVVPATHRVVRLPQKERFSMPFEMKPNDDALLRNLVCPEKEPNPSTFIGLTKRLQWDRIVRQVDRADGIEPSEKPPAEQKEEQDFGQATHDVQLPSITVS